MTLSNRLRAYFGRPIKFNHDVALANARMDATRELDRLGNKAIEEEVNTWVHAPDDATDGIECDNEQKVWDQ